MSKLHRTHLASAGILVIVFASGVLLGLALDRGLEAASPAPPTTAAVPDSAAEGERRYMFERVGLTADQRTVVDSIVTHHRERLRSLRREVSEQYDPRYWAIVDNTREAIKGVMSHEQANLYDSLIVEHDREERAESGVLRN